MDINELTNTKDVTSQMSAQDMEENKVMAILAYIGFLVLIPMFVAKESKFAKFHVSQGFTLFVIELAMSVVGTVVSFIPVVGWIIGIIFWLIDLVCLVLAIMGIVNAATAKAKELPVTGKFKLVQ